MVMLVLKMAIVLMVVVVDNDYFYNTTIILVINHTSYLQTIYSLDVRV